MERLVNSFFWFIKVFRYRRKRFYATCVLLILFAFALPYLIVDRPIESARVGSRIKLGQYEQNNNLDDGPETIQWIVLEKQEDRLLVLSRYILDTYPFDADTESWEINPVNKWLTEKFVSSFTEEEQKRIIEITVLTTEQLRELMPVTSRRIASGTEYTRGKELYSFSGYSLWWVRSPESASKFTMHYVLTDGSIDRFRSYSAIFTYGIRPAMWIYINNPSEQ